MHTHDTPYIKLDTTVCVKAGHFVACARVVLVSAITALTVLMAGNDGSVNICRVKCALGENVSSIYRQPEVIEIICVV